MAREKVQDSEDKAYQDGFDDGFDEGSEWAYSWVLSHLEGHKGLQEVISEIERMWQVVYNEE